jgi:hypothetical protein
VKNLYDAPSSRAMRADSGLGDGDIDIVWPPSSVVTFLSRRGVRADEAPGTRKDLERVQGRESWFSLDIDVEQV